MESGTYTVKTGGFEGPFELLLSLVEKRKLFIGDVSLSAVTEDYLSYMNRLPELHPALVSNFVLVASTLLLIKSKSLLPNLNLTQEEEGDIKDLEERLRLYEVFSKLEHNVKDAFGEKIIFPLQERKNDVLVFLPDSRITKDSMMGFARGVLLGMPQKTSLPVVPVKKVISIEEMLDKLSSRAEESLKMSFKEFAGSGKEGREKKLEMIVGFLAMLELVRQGVLHVAQEEGGGDIIMEKSPIFTDIS